MKNIKYFILALAVPVLFASCGFDNYHAPSETFRGKFVDKGTGEPFQTAVGATGIRIRMMEYSWSDNPHPYDFYAMANGTFQNTKIFKGTYGVTPEGAFVPLGEERFDIKGVFEKVYEVEPLLRVEWVGEPVVKDDGTAEFKVRITRGTDNPDWQHPVAEAWLFVSENQHVGDYNYSGVYSTHLTAGEIKLGEVVTIVTGCPQGMSNEPVKFPEFSRKYFVRAAARTNVQITSMNKYNYSVPIEITTKAR